MSFRKKALVLFALILQLACLNIVCAEVADGYYLERRSYGTQKESDPPRYVEQANKTWLKNYEAFRELDWLDLGFEYRVRYEHRDNDFRRSQECIDDPILLRTRAYVGVKNILDPLRFAVEVQDARRNHSDYRREFDTRDVNQADILQSYLELYFKDTLLGKDDLGNARPISIRAGRHAWEAIDRRLLARNEWRNTTNTFQGVRSNIGDKENDWQLELFAVRPVQRFTKQLDEVDQAQNFYGVIAAWRAWSDVVTLEPYYLLLKQQGDKVEYDNNGIAATASAKIDREIHTAGLRAYGLIGKSGFDYDLGYVKQWGHQDRKNIAGTFIDKLDHEAYAYNAELGYLFQHPWKPRLSAFYGFASGDKDPNDKSNQRFDRLFGFARPWSNDDYIQMENISTPKLRLEFEPQLSYFKGVKVDTGFSWYHLDSATDRWNAGANLRDTTGKSGKDLGKEFDFRVRLAIKPQIAVNIGYAHFFGGDFVKATSRNVAGQSDRENDSDFFYTEVSLLGF